jgi:hypothetical protein
VLISVTPKIWSPINLKNLNKKKKREVGLNLHHMKVGAVTRAEKETAAIPAVEKRVRKKKKVRKTRTGKMKRFNDKEY